MDIKKIPVLGRLDETLSVLVANFALLGVVCLLLGVLIPFYPQVLNFLVSALLIVAAVIFLNIAGNFYRTKKKLSKWF